MNANDLGRRQFLEHAERRDEVVSALHDVFEETFGVIVLLVDGGYALRRGEHEALRAWIRGVL